MQSSIYGKPIFPMVQKGVVKLESIQQKMAQCKLWALSPIALIICTETLSRKAGRSMEILRSLDAHIHILSEFLHFRLQQCKGHVSDYLQTLMCQFLKSGTIFDVVKPIHIFEALLEKLQHLGNSQYVSRVVKYNEKSFQYFTAFFLPT